MNIWNNPWLPALGHSRILGHQININCITVNELIDGETGTRKIEILERLFDSSHCERILQIPIAQSSIPDILIWRHDATGTYSVQTGYKTLITKLQRPMGGNPPLLQ